MDTEIFHLITFNSTHMAIKAEKCLISSGVKVKIIPVPSEITSSCGISIKININDLHEAQNIMLKNNIDVSGYYHIKKMGLSKEIQSI